MNSITLFLCYFLSDYLSKIFHWDSLVVVQKRESVMIRGIFTSFFRYRDMRYALQLYECIIINLIYVEWSECEEVEVSEINNSEQWDVVDVVQLLCCRLLVTRGWVPQATADLLCICRAKIQIQMLTRRHYTNSHSTTTAAAVQLLNFLVCCCVNTTKKMWVVELIGYNQERGGRDDFSYYFTFMSSFKRRVEQKNNRSETYKNDK